MRARAKVSCIQTLSSLALGLVVCKIPLLARTWPKGWTAALQSGREIIEYLVNNWPSSRVLAREKVSCLQFQPVHHSYNVFFNLKLS